MIIYLSLAILTVPVQLLRSTDKFKSIGLISCAVIIFTISIACIQAPSYYAEYKPEFVLFDDSEPVQMVQNLGVFVFGYYCFDTIFDMKNMLGKSATEKKLNKVNGYNLLLMFIVFQLIGVIGYVS